MKIGEVSTQLGIPASTIRYYEQIGLIQPQRRVSGQREFDSGAIFALEFVRLSQAAGFTIAETKTLLESYTADQSNGDTWQELANQKQTDVRAQIQALQQVDSILTELRSCQCETLTECLEIGLARNSQDSNARR